MELKKQNPNNEVLKDTRAFKDLYDDCASLDKDFMLELKPAEEGFTTNDKTSVKLKIDKLSQEKLNISAKENVIICDNILLKFFALDDYKFFACLEKLNEWGFEICFKEFIMYYYFKILKDNMLKNYIMFNLSQILNVLKTRLELKLLEGMKNFSFATIEDDKKIEQLKNEIVGKQTVLLNVKAPNFNEFSPMSQAEKTKVETPQEKKDFRIEVLNRLRYENPRLLE